MKRKLLCVFLMLLLILSIFCINIYFLRISEAEANQDVAVTGVTPSKTSVKLEEPVNITVTVENQGTENATFNVSLYHDTVAIEMKTVTNLTTGQSGTLVFTWNTTDVKDEVYALASKDKSYTIEAVASTLPGETDTGDNTLEAPSRIRVVSKYISVRPERTVDETLTVGKNYTVTIYTDYNGTDVWGWQISLAFSPAILECVEIRNGDLITTDKNPNARFLNSTNNNAGTLSAGAFFYYVSPDAPPTTSGPGTLASIIFRVKGSGTSDITLGGDTKLQAYDAVADQIEDAINDYLPDINHLLSGSFSNAITQIVDIAVVSVEVSPTSVMKGDLVNVTVTVENQGTTDQAFDVKAYYDYAPSFPGQNVIGTRTTQTLAANASKTFVFTWNTTLVAEGNYIITALVSGVQGDADASDNQLNSNQRVSVKLEVRPLPVTELIIGIVIIIAVIAAIYFILRRRKKEKKIIY